MFLFAFFYAIVVPALSFCLAGPHLIRFIVLLLIGALLATGAFLFQITCWYKLLERAIILHRHELGSEKREVRERLIWHLRKFHWLPIKGLKPDEVTAIIEELSKSLVAPRS